MSINISEIIKRKDEHAQRFSSILKEVALNIGEISANLKKNHLIVDEGGKSFTSRLSNKTTTQSISK
jgi:hypothetical protein